MAVMLAYIDATAGLANGTLVSIEGANTIPIPFAALNASVPVALRCTTGYEAPGSVVITAPELFEVSLTGTSSWGSTVTLSYVGDKNARLYVRQVNAIPRDSSPYVLLNIDYGGALVPDTEPPSQVTGLTATNGDTESVLEWDAATDNVAVTGYRVKKATQTGETYTGIEQSVHPEWWTIPSARINGGGTADEQQLIEWAFAAIDGTGQSPLSWTYDGSGSLGSIGCNGSSGSGSSPYVWFSGTTAIVWGKPNGGVDTSPERVASAVATGNAVEGTPTFGSYSTLTSTETDLTYTATGLANGAAYSFTVAARDAAGNWGAESDAAEAVPS